LAVLALTPQHRGLVNVLLAMFNDPELRNVELRIGKFCMLASFKAKMRRRLLYPSRIKFGRVPIA
jgi:hypothetical protein